MNPRLLPSATVARSVLRTQSDARLTDLARAGSEPAFEAIVSRYRRSLVRYCARVVGDGDAEEAVQEALLKAHAALLGGDPVRRLAPWLHVVAHNTALSYLRARSSRPQPAEADYDLCAAMDSSADYRQELGEVLDAVRSLPERQRDAIVMRELEGRSYDEIAARLGSSHGAVRQLLHRARSSVRERLAALLPLEPLLRWALTGAGGADGAAATSLSGACVLGAKACAALILPATVALIASAPAPRPKTTTVAKARAVTATTFAGRAARRTPAPSAARVAAVSTVATRPASARASRIARGWTVQRQGGTTTSIERPGTARSTPSGTHGSAQQPAVAPSPQPASAGQSTPPGPGHAVARPAPQPGAPAAALPAGTVAAGTAPASTTPATTPATGGGGGGNAWSPGTPGGTQGNEPTVMAARAR